MGTDETFHAELRLLRDAAGLTNRQIVELGNQQAPPLKFTSQQLSDWFTGKVRAPRHTKSQDRLIVLLEARAKDRNQGYKPRGIEWWRSHRPLPGAASATESRSLGRLIDELSDDDAELYGVHRSVRTGQPDQSVLTPYLQRDHDLELRSELSSAAAGVRMVVLTGESSTGKTRACWEMLRAAPPGWRLWHPTETQVEQLGRNSAWPAPRTIIWFNEAPAVFKATGGRRARSSRSTQLAANRPRPNPDTRVDVAEVLGRAD